MWKSLVSDMHEKVVIVTGGSSGIGRATALALAEAGASVVVGAREGKQLAAIVEEISSAGGRAVAVAGDVAEEETAVRLVDAAVKTYGGLDAAYNNAGAILGMAPLQQLTLEDWSRSLDVNLTSFLLGLKHQAPAIAARGGGSILCTVSSVGEDVGIPGLGAYAAAKAGIRGLVTTAAIEFADQKIRVNAISFSSVDTPSNMGNDPDTGAEVRPKLEGLHALGRMASAKEAASAAIFLLSDASSFVTGTSLNVDGGMAIYRA